MRLNKKLICLLFIIPIFSLTLFGKSATSLAGAPTITPLTNHTWYDFSSYDPQINDRGDVVWRQYDTVGATWAYNIYLLPDGETIPINLTNYTDHAESLFSPQINNNGDVVWYQTVLSGWSLIKANVFLYNGTTETITNLTNLPVGNVKAFGPLINDNGDVVYQHHSPGPFSWWPKTDVYLIKGATAVSPPSPINLSDTEQAIRYQINNNGEVVWVQWDDIDSTYNAYLYDGTNTSALTDYTYNEKADYVQINNNGDVVWQSFNRPANLSDLFYYDGTNTTNLTNNVTTNWVHEPQINDNGELVWRQSNYTGSKVSLYDGTNIIDLTALTNIDTAEEPQINNKGEVVWLQLDDNSPNFTYDVFRYDGAAITNVTNNPLNTNWAHEPQINNRGDVVWGQSDRVTPQGNITNNIYLATFNQPPVASCSDVTVDAGAECNAPASIDNASSDPDDDPITITQDPAGPYGLGDTVVTLTVTDDSGESDSCTATVTVEDNTCPTVTAKLVSVKEKKKKGCFRVELTAEDNCDNDPQIVATINFGTNGGAGVVDGQLVELKRKKKFKMKSDDGDSGSSDDDSSGDDCGTVRFEGPLFTLTANAIDSAGNFACVEDEVTIIFDDGSSDDSRSGHKKHHHGSNDGSRSGHGKRK